MKIQLSFETIPLMFEVLDAIRSNMSFKAKLEQLLEHPDYKVEFERYEGRVSKEEFIEFLSNINSLKQEEILNDDLKIQYKFIQEYFAQPEKFKQYYNKLLAFPSKLLEEQYLRARNGLPESVKLDDIQMAITISIGRSGAWAYKNHMHFDLLKLVSVTDFDGFVNNIGHELHHIGFNRFCEQNNLVFEKMPLEEAFYLAFASEGLAVKYCNNAKGVLSDPINPDKPVNVGLHKESWEYLLNDFEDTFRTFKKHINLIREKKITTHAELLELFKQYWMNFYTKDQSKDELPKLAFSRLYSMGNELYGTLHDVFGMHEVYEIIKDLSRLPDAFEKALREKGKNL